MPPAKPGALGCEPLEGGRGSQTRPRSMVAPKGGRSAPQIHLLQTFILPDILSYHLLVSPHCGDEVSSRPEVLTYEGPLLLSVHASQVYRTLSFDRPDHLRYRIFRRDRDQHFQLDKKRGNVNLLPWTDINEC
jgi:hypothetical protein